MGYEIRFSLIPNDEASLACVVCGYVRSPHDPTEKTCTYAIVIKSPQRRVWSGIHRKCAKPFIVINGKKNGKLHVVPDFEEETREIRLPLGDEDETPKL